MAVLIIGQGLSGSIMAYTCWQNKIPFKIIDNNSPFSASKIATGLFNPIVFKRITESWLASEVLPFLKKFYQDFEQEFSSSILNYKPLKRIIKTEGEQKQWEIICSQANSLDIFLIDKIIHQDDANAPLGYVLIATGYVLVQDFLSQFKDILLQNNLLTQEEFEYNHLLINADNIVYKEVVFSQIIFCEGWKAIDNPYFKFLPFFCSKGEHIEIQTDQLDANYIVSNGVHILPLSATNYIVGSTYKWEDLNNTPTEYAENFFSEKLKNICSTYKVIKHEAAVRPTVRHRRPFVGKHPIYNNVYILNGFGSKTTSLAPFFAQELLNNILFNTPILADVEIAKYYH